MIQNDIKNRAIAKLAAKGVQYSKISVHIRPVCGEYMHRIELYDVPKESLAGVNLKAVAKEIAAEAGYKYVMFSIHAPKGVDYAYVGC